MFAAIVSVVSYFAGVVQDVLLLQSRVYQQQLQDCVILAGINMYILHHISKWDKMD